MHSVKQNYLNYRWMMPSVKQLFKLQVDDVFSETELFKLQVDDAFSETELFKLQVDDAFSETII